MRALSPLRVPWIDEPTSRSATSCSVNVRALGPCCACVEFHVVSASATATTAGTNVRLIEAPSENIHHKGHQGHKAKILWVCGSCLCVLCVLCGSFSRELWPRLQYVLDRFVIEVEPEMAWSDHFDALWRPESRIERGTSEHHDRRAKRVAAEAAARERLACFGIEVVEQVR